MPSGHYIRIRVAGLLSRRGKVLLVLHERDGRQYWLPPGGGVEYGETLQDALKREFFEETNLKVEVGKLLFVNETIAPDGSRHGLHFIFLVKLKSGRLRVKTDARLRGASFVSWAALGKIPLRPPIPKPLLQAYRRNFREPTRFLGNHWVP